MHVLRIAGVQTLAVIFVSAAFGRLALMIGARGCGASVGWYDLYFWIFLAVGLIATFISLYYIFRPSVWIVTVERRLVMSTTDASLPFYSTSPVFVFLDAVLFIPAFALLQAGRSESMCQFNSEWAFGWAFFLMAVLFPLVRTVSWFGLKRQIDARRIEIPWATLIMWWVLVVPITVYLTFTYLDKNVFPRLRVPVVNELTFKGGLKQNPRFMAGIVRVQGKLVREIAKCGLFGKDPEKSPYPSGTVLLDMGKGNGQIMVKANRPHLVDQLEIEAENKKDKYFEAFGRLTSLPNPAKKLVCGIGKADDEQKGGLALLEIEMPID